MNVVNFKDLTASQDLSASKIAKQRFPRSKNIIVLVNLLIIMVQAINAQSWNSSTPPTLSGAGPHTVTISGTPSGTLNVPDNANVTITGTVTSTTATMTLNIPANATVFWQASVTGSTESGVALVEIENDGTLVVSSQVPNVGSIVQTGGGRAITSQGDIEVGGDATITAVSYAIA